MRRAGLHHLLLDLSDHRIIRNCHTLKDIAHLCADFREILLLNCRDQSIDIRMLGILIQLQILIHELC